MISLDQVHRQRAELRRLYEPPADDEKPEGIGIVRFDALCPDGAISCLERTREVLGAVLRNSTGRWPTNEEWRALLPHWFVERCGPEKTKEQVEAWLQWWRSLSDEEQLRAEREKTWSLSSWLYWMDPDQRHWHWWDALAEDDKKLKVATTVDEWPFPWGALAWLLRASGASRVEAEE